MLLNVTFKNYHQCAHLIFQHPLQYFISLHSGRRCHVDQSTSIKPYGAVESDSEQDEETYRQKQYEQKKLRFWIRHRTAVSRPSHNFQKKLETLALQLIKQINYRKLQRTKNEYNMTPNIFFALEQSLQTNSIEEIYSRINRTIHNSDIYLTVTLTMLQRFCWLRMKCECDDTKMR